MNYKLPKIAVLMPTYNGKPWLIDQVDSILQQQHVNIKLFISDDMSADGTWEMLLSLADQEGRVKLLSRGEKFGAAGSHFYRLLRDADFSDCDFVAYADQDDIWDTSKLAQLSELAYSTQACGVSSNVFAFWEDGRKKLIEKSQPQRPLDFIFESAGPGCSFLMTRKLAEKVREKILNQQSVAASVALHDWLTYAVCRANNGKWVIDSKPTVNYRQHDGNVFGANKGFVAKWGRLKMLRSGWYRNEVIKICKVCTDISKQPIFVDIADRLCRMSRMDRLWLLRHVGKFRRSLKDRVLLSIAIITNQI